MTKTTMKRVWLGAVALVLTAGVGACSDQPMGVEEPYEVQMEGESTGGDNCIIVNGLMYCDG